MAKASNPAQDIKPPHRLTLTQPEHLSIKSNPNIHAAKQHLTLLNAIIYLPLTGKWKMSIKQPKKEYSPLWDLCSAEHQQIVFNTWDINLQEHLFESSHIKLLCISWWHLVCSFHLGNSRTPSQHRELSPSALRRPEQSCISKPNIIIHLTVYYLHMSNTAGEHHNSTVCVISYCTVAISCCNP